MSTELPPELPPELPKAYDPKAVEPQANAVWTEEKLFHAEPTDPGEPYAIVIPPPNVTAALHLGHALNNTLQDILTRWRRMAGDNAVWMPGTDHAGIATQTVVEKRVLAEEGKRRTEFQRDEFVAKIQTWKDEYERRITEQLKAMGCSCDWDRQAFTMDEPRARAVREAFFQLFKDGLIYRGKRLVNWDPATQTALADDEVEMEEIDGHFYYLRYPLEHAAEINRDGSYLFSYVTVATTRPETMLGDTAIAINPRDPRAAALRGKKVRLPIVNRVIPIIEDDYVVLPDPKSDDPKAQFATGFLKVTPAHDPNDYEIGLRHKLPLINVLAPDGTISDQYGWPKDDVEAGGAEEFLGLDRFEARKAVVEWFKQNNLLENVKPYRHSVGHSYRSHVPIEPYLSDQWYCKVTDDRLAGAALRAIAREQSDSATPSPRRGEGGGEGQGALEEKRSFDSTTRSPLSPTLSPAGRGSKDWEGQLKFFPARYAKTFQSWHENIRDWCISRQLWWGHRIPVWSGSPNEVADTVEAQLNRWASEGKADYQKKPFVHQGDDSGWAARDARGNLLEWFVAVAPGNTGVEQWLEKNGFTQDPDVLDTWFSSGLWPMSTLGWPERTAALEKWNPTHTLCTAREIITLWVGRMVMFNLYFLDRLPFTDVSIHPMVQDGEGRKMSKSLGNGVDPLDIISSHGADAMRFTLAHMTTQTQDVRMPVERDPKSGKNTSPKFDIGRNFCNKVWNAVRFGIMNLSDEATKRRSDEGVDESKWSLADRWIVSRFNRTVAAANEALSNYRFDQYAKTCYDFFWSDLCDWYLEAIKPAMRDEKRAGQTAHVLAAVLDGSLRLMHPMIPFITETIFWKLNEVRPKRGLPGRLECPPSKRLIQAAWPKVGEFAEAAESIFPKLQEVVGAIRNLRNEYKVDPKKSVTVTIIAPAEAARQITENREAVELLGVCVLKQVGPDAKAPAKASRATAAGAEIYVEGLVDEAGEGARLAKRRDEVVKSIGAMEGRVANAAYVAKAPPHLVKQTLDQLAELKAELLKLETALAKLG
ncbi:MAG: valyl-tRNA synthetase [Phycisphaerales bacterium]|jgi:valyl-tRNA synthetase|nr:valyl-tRNA synthetase [Phycisphaerales bacterium]